MQITALSHDNPVCLLIESLRTIHLLTKDIQTNMNRLHVKRFVIAEVSSRHCELVFVLLFDSMKMCSIILQLYGLVSYIVAIRLIYISRKCRVVQMFILPLHLQLPLQYLCKI